VVENIHTQLMPGISRAKAVLEASSRTVIARLLSMLCVLAVFVPSFFMNGVERQLFVPLSLAVGFAMIASYLLSSTLVPVFAIWMMKESHRREELEGAFGRLRARYERVLAFVLRRRWPVILSYFAICAIILLIASPRIGTEIFPDSNGPVLRMRIKAPIGTRIEETEPTVLHALDLIRTTIGAQYVEITSDYVGVQPSSYPVNLIHLFTSGPEEALVQVQLRPGHPNDERLREDLRAAFSKELPDLKLSFEAGDIISQVMSFGSPTPVQIDVQGVDLDQNYAYLAKIEAELHKLSFLRDISLVQLQKYPTVEVNIDRQYAGQFGLTMADVTASLVPATGSSFHRTQLLARSPHRQCLSDSGADSSESRARRASIVISSINARWPVTTATRSGGKPAVWHHAGDDRAPQRSARCEPHGQFARHYFGSGTGEDSGYAQKHRGTSEGIYRNGSW